MATLRLYLKTESKESIEGIIYAQLSHRKEPRYTKSTGIRMPVKMWDNDKRRVKGTSQDAMEKGIEVSHVEKSINEIIYENRVNFTISKAKPAIEKFLIDLGLRNPVEEPVERNGILDYLDEFVDRGDNPLTHSTKKKYRTLKSMITGFCAFYHQPATFDIIDKRFGERFIEYMINEKQLLNNSSAKYIQCLRTYLKWCSEARDVKIDAAYLKFKGKPHNVVPTYLTEEELLKFYAMEFEHGRHEKVRDLFCLSAWTGLRYSDIMQVAKDNINNNKIYLTMVKTKDVVAIPLNRYSRALLEKYNYILPKISNQKANEYLKEAAKIAGFDSIERTIRYRGAERVETVKHKYEKLTFHDARRTFVTLMLLKKFQDRTIMQMTGHKDVASFSKYAKIDDSVVEKAMAEAWD